jgi:hypothetical protein
LNDYFCRQLLIFFDTACIVFIPFKGFKGTFCT